ncbi:MAG: hypothetical protein ACRDPY_19560 [Streptosporangiaceae bacterium]
MKRYKFQALVTLYQPPDGGSGVQFGPSPCRMVLRAQNDETHRNQVFSALVSSDDAGPFRPGSSRVLVTLRIMGDDVADFLGIGSSFRLWLGGDVGLGVVTRRLFV